MSGAVTVAVYALRESLRRRVFAVVLVLSAGFLALYAAGSTAAFDEVNQLGSVTNASPKILTGSTLLGLAMFATLFLGTVLAVFLTLGAVRGDAERGVLQPLVVRPLGRPTLLAGRFLGAAVVCAAYVAVLYTSSVLITHAAGNWWPDRPIGPGLGLVGGIVIIAALSLLGSVYLSATANGIATFMVFGGGLVAGLLGQIGEGISSSTLTRIGVVGSYALPFEALYRSGLQGLAADTSGLTGFVVRLGPFGGGHDFGPLLVPWCLLYLAAVALLAVWGFRRSDL